MTNKMNKINRRIQEYIDNYQPAKPQLTFQAYNPIKRNTERCMNQHEKNVQRLKNFTSWQNPPDDEPSDEEKAAMAEYLLEKAINRQEDRYERIL